MFARLLVCWVHRHTHVFILRIQLLQGTEGKKHMKSLWVLRNLINKAINSVISNHPKTTWSHFISIQIWHKTFSLILYLPFFLVRSFDQKFVHRHQSNDDWNNNNITLTYREIERERSREIQQQNARTNFNLCGIETIATSTNLFETRWECFMFVFPLLFIFVYKYSYYTHFSFQRAFFSLRRFHQHTTFWYRCFTTFCYHSELNKFNYPQKKMRKKN